MQLHALHPWNVPPAEAIAIQKSLAAQVRSNDAFDVSAVRLVAGVDVSVKDDASGVAQSRAAIVVLTFPALEVVEVVLKQMPTPFPYIPGLLTFREGPVLVQAFETLQAAPDVFLFDGMGIAHPRRMGIAAHMGLWLDRPTLGVGKSHLFGRYTEPPQVRGAWTPLTDRVATIGGVLRTRESVHPVFISAGQRMNLDSALQLVMACTTRYRLPEPIRAAHKAAGL